MAKRKKASKKTPPGELTPVQERLIQSAVDIVESPEPNEVLFQHSVLCQTILPYRDPGDDVRRWVQQQGAVALMIEAGTVLHPDAEFSVRSFNQNLVELGLPYGAAARLILVHINSEAVRKQSPVVEVEDSMTSFIKRLGLPTTGRYIRNVKDQIARLAAARITFAFKVNGEARTINLKSDIVKGFDLWWPKNEEQRVLWPSTVRLDDAYFNNLVHHAVPLDERAVAALSHNCMALDVYVWLAQRLHRIRPNRSDFVSWVNLWHQFGPNYSEVRYFRRAFRGALKQVLLQYPAARHAIQEAKGQGATSAAGLRLHHASPPVARTTIHVSRPEQARPSPGDKRLSAAARSDKGWLRDPKKNG
ncbi:MAG: replication protein RepA [Bacteroidota bacterium]